MKIGALSQITGVPISALRFYESVGLLKSERTPSNYRRFSEEMVDQVRRIQGFRSLDLSLPEIKRMLQVSASPDDSCLEICELIQGHLEQVRRQINRLKELENELKRLSLLCSGRPGPSGCKILRELS